MITDTAKFIHIHSKKSRDSLYATTYFIIQNFKIALDIDNYYRNPWWQNTYIS